MKNTDTYSISALEKKIMQLAKDNSTKLTRDLVTVQNRLYSQLESLSWLQRRLSIKGQLPSLRGWAASPDVLLKLHTYIMQSKPRVVVEFGSGASSIVIADALRQNGIGYLISIDHSKYYSDKVLSNLAEENLMPWVELRVSKLEPWVASHMNAKPEDKASAWYSKDILKGIESVDLLLVDGPPGAICQFARYPALPALIEHLASSAQVWMDDTIRQEEREICQHWANDYGFELEFFSLEKGLGVLTRQ